MRWPVLRASGLSGLVRCFVSAQHKQGGGPRSGVAGSLPPATSPGHLGGGLSHPATCFGTPLACSERRPAVRIGLVSARPSPHPARGGTPLRRGRARVAVAYPPVSQPRHHHDRRPRVGPARSLFRYQGTALPWPSPRRDRLPDAFRAGPGSPKKAYGHGWLISPSKPGGRPAQSGPLSAAPNWCAPVVCNWCAPVSSVSLSSRQFRLWFYETACANDPVASRG